MRFKFSSLIWGTFLLLAAAFIVFNQINGFADIGVGSIVAAVLSLAVIVQCVASLHFAPLPIPIAILYIIFQAPLELPYIKTWALILASVLASMGLAALLPRKSRYNHVKDKDYCRTSNRHRQVRTESGANDNNPSINVNFGAVARHLRADCLETAR